uniref:Putative gtp-binding protein hflx n=1 Tax=Schistosoma mansoni TaxID=6183 RepID=A0A3Q0KCQ8_SCHMA
MFRNVGRLFRYFPDRRCSSLVDADSNKVYDELLKKSYLLPENGHDIVIIQPHIKGALYKRINNKFPYLPKNDPNVDEAIALVDSLGFWTTVGVIFCNIKAANTNRGPFFSKGIWQNVSDSVIAYRDGKQSVQTADTLPNEENNTFSEHIVKKRATAVLVNWPRLTTLQLALMQQAWLIPVYDRYTLVVQLFSLRSRTPEAKLQAKLAEIGLLRARIPAFFETPNMIKRLIDRSDFATKERLIQILNQTEASLLNQLEKISKQRIHHRRNHRRDMEKHHLPLVAVVGYTNAGKTSLIRYLSKSDKLTSSPEVFATLDITHHRSRLPILPNKTEENNMTSNQLSSGNVSDGCCSSSIGLPGIQMLLLDTIGFMSDLPTNLLAAFRATLDECLDADLILHIVDVSQPEWQLQVNHVEELLCSIGVLVTKSTNSGHTSDSNTFEPPQVLKIGNKVDRIGSNDVYTGFDALISAKNGTGMEELTSKVRLAIMKRLGWFSRTLDVRQGGPSFQWIYSNAMVTSVEASPSNSERLRITAIFTPVGWIKFCRTFKMASSENVSQCFK